MILQHLRAALMRLYGVGIFMTFAGGSGCVFIIHGIITREWQFNPFAATRYREDFLSCCFLVLIPVLFIAGLVVLGRAVYLTIRPGRRPVLLRLSVFGSPYQVVQEIDRELANKRDKITIGEAVQSFTLVSNTYGQVILTPSWIVRFEAFDLKFVAIWDIVEARKVVNKFYTPRSGEVVTYSVDIQVRQGRNEKFVLSEADVDHLLEEITQRRQRKKAAESP
jgi:hypothetical protein